MSSSTASGVSTNTIRLTSRRMIIFIGGALPLPRPPLPRRGHNTSTLPPGPSPHPPPSPAAAPLPPGLIIAHGLDPDHLVALMDQDVARHGNGAIRRDRELLLGPMTATLGRQRRRQQREQQHPTFHVAPPVEDIIQERHWGSAVTSARVSRSY